MSTNARDERKLGQNLPRIFLLKRSLDRQMLSAPSSLYSQPIKNPRVTLIFTGDLKRHHVVSPKIDHSKLFTTKLELNNTPTTLNVRIKIWMYLPEKISEETQPQLRPRKVRIQPQNRGYPIIQ